MFRQFFGAEIKAARKSAGLSQEQVAPHIDFNTKGAVSRIEKGETTPTRLQFQAMAKLYGLNEDQTEFLENLLATARDPEWWIPYGQRPGAFSGLLAIEAKAYRIRNYDHYSVPGLLQTDQYARAVATQLDVGMSADQREGNVQLRMERQDRVWKKEHPPTATFVVDEGALRRLPYFLTGPNLRAQLSRLLSPPEGSIVQVLPFAAGGQPSLATYAMFDLDFDSPISTVVVHEEGSTSRRHGQLVESGDKEEVTQFELIYERTQAAALSPAESATWISRMMEDIEDD